jgi:hypothetical protein
MTEFAPALFVGVDFGGVSHYRLMLPARELGAQLYIRTNDMEKAKMVGPIDAPVNVYSMPRSTEMLHECMQMIVHPKKRLIIDIDDCLRAVCEDGRHPAVEQWRELLPKHEWLLSRADMVTCTTPFLEDYARSCGAENVRLIPNALDIERWNIKREPRHKTKTIVGWSGSYGHEGALEAHAPALFDLLMRRGDEIGLASVGVPISQFFPEAIRGGIHDVGFVPMTRHPQVLTQFHINIGPTEDTDFYRAKSDLRALEAFASDSVFLGGEITYGDVYRTMGATGGMLSPEEMVADIEFFIDSPKLNHDVRKRQLKYLRENRLIEHTIPLWEDAILSVIP